MEVVVAYFKILSQQRFEASTTLRKVLSHTRLFRVMLVFNVR